MLESSGLILDIVLDRSRSRSRSYSPSQSRRHDQDNGGHKSRSKAPKVEYITEFGGSNSNSFGLERISPPLSPPSQAEIVNRSGHLTFYSQTMNLTFSVSCVRLSFQVLCLFGSIIIIPGPVTSSGLDDFLRGTETGIFFRNMRDR